MEQERFDKIQPPGYGSLRDELAGLRARVQTRGGAIYDGWCQQIHRPEFRASALNLAHYLTLRSRDLRTLQRRLMPLGLSSLGRLEARVMPNLDAVTACLAALAGTTAPANCHMPSTTEFFLGENILARNAEAVFGQQKNARSHILATLDTEAAENPEFVRNLVQCGVDAVRINCAHDDADAWQQMINNARAAGRFLDRKIPVLMDIAGPKLRITGVMPQLPIPVVTIGDEMLLCAQLPEIAQPGILAVTCQPQSVLSSLRIGDAVSVDDGKLRGKIVRVEPDGLVVRFERGRLKGIKMRPGRGINFPTASLHSDPLTAKDLHDLDFVCANADMVGFSFVEASDHVAMLQNELAARRADWQDLALIAKIETPRAVHNLPEIIVQAAGRQPLAVMIARGDLAVEMGFSRGAEMQEEILWICEAAHIPAIWATQVLENLVRKGLPSRGEMTDAAMAGRAECVMLNKGPNILEAVGVLDELLGRMAEHQIKKTPTLRVLHSWAAPE